MRLYGYFAKVTFALVAIQILYLLGLGLVAILALGCFIIWVFLFETNARGIVEKLFLLCIYTLPFSFIAFDGTLYSEKPLSFFNLFFLSLILILTLFAVAVKTIRIDYLTLRVYVCVLFLFIGIVCSYLVSPDEYLWLITVGTLLIYLLFPLLALAGGRIKQESPYPSFFLDAFQFTVLSIAIVVLLQKSLFHFGFKLGTVEVETLYTRLAFIGLLSDRSQAAVLLAAAAAIFFVRGNRAAPDWLASYLAWACGTTCILASGATSARAGVASFFLSFGVLLLTGKVSFGRIAPVALIGLPTALLAATFLFAQRPSMGHGLFTPIYRAPLIFDWFEIFWDKAPLSFFTGVGLGSQNHQIVGYMFTPHNIIMEAILNGGVWMLIFLLFPVFLLRALGTNPPYLAGLWTIGFGAMVSPSMIESRFFPIYLLIGLVFYWKLGLSKLGARVGHEAVATRSGGLSGKTT